MMMASASANATMIEVMTPIMIPVWVSLSAKTGTEKQKKTHATVDVHLDLAPPLSIQNALFKDLISLIYRTLIVPTVDSH